MVVLINQVRANLSYGASTTTGGGFALRHVTTWKLKMKRTSTDAFVVTIGGEKRTVGHEIAIYIERNGVAPAYRTAIVSMINVATKKYGPVGIDQVDEATTLGIDTGVIKQAGAWYTLPGGERYQGRDKVVAALREDPEMVSSIRQAVLASVAGEILDEVEPEAIPEVDGDEKKPKFRQETREAEV